MFVGILCLAMQLRLSCESGSVMNGMALLALQAIM